MSFPHSNLSWTDAIQRSPVLDYARCTDASGRPPQHEGDWPIEGFVYPVRLVQDAKTGAQMIYILGFSAAAPHFNGFAPHRFRMVCSMWLN
ncbi:hypothetical protein [Hymenobacter latericus]|uniref:hypothetical protein n=1 Tax=Hymenobacter sp. YIM 151858-1 TaxID=2987688 RepID=UPI002226F4DB|nr:hypothetical protein [Hymenobacter sp. YIM 151858-1]UYZ57905.1 hypothetical protein OIS50_12650 [Hymenobacter sp. YIM 151858-1]